MKCLDKIPDAPLILPSPISITIGTFDGIHLGHKKIFQKMKEISHTRVVITFKNNPRSILQPDTPISSLISSEEKASLLTDIGIDVLINLTFTKEFATTPYDVFLRRISDVIPFSHLVLGKGAAFGKGHEGDQSRIEILGEERKFIAHYIEKEKDISSNRIRTLLAEGKKQKAEELLGRSFP